jgi:hypothetical protein
MLMLVTDRDESLRAFEAFERAFTDGADPPFRRVVGFPSGSWRVDVRWHGSDGIWGVFVREPLDHQSREPLKRFWNSFGVADPNQPSSLSITVEINPPHEGENRRTAGIFLRDELGRLYVGHTGRLGGRGFKQAEFRKFAQAQGFEWQEITTPSPFQERELISKLAGYVRTVAEFKNQVATGLR